MGSSLLPPYRKPLVPGSTLIRTTDANAQAVINGIIARGVTPSAGQQTAINDFFIALKAGSLFTPMRVMYGMVGATAATNGMNWVLPGTNDITWHGTPTQDANGVTGNFTDAWGDTGLLDNTLTQASKAFGCYCRTNANDSYQQVGTDGADGSGLHVRFTDGNGYFANPVTTALITIPGQNGLGLLTSSRTAANLHTAYRNAASIGTSAGAPGAGEAFPYLLLGNGINFSGYNLSFAFVSTGLTGANMTALYNAVQALQTALGRQV